MSSSYKIVSHEDGSVTLYECTPRGSYDSRADAVRAMGRLIQAERDRERPEPFDNCAQCDAEIFEGDPYTRDSECGYNLCAHCSPTWADFNADPEGFWDNDADAPFSERRASELIEAHLASGGKLSDSMAQP
ncbi:hypothetical protein FDP22_12450 [Paroceanicella profunda]|uniref:Uncharacterized protein n=1 Tax=Paroceanicella profunda TaxID=2579971 RepID=A0A5B8FHZ6_9RHOB|nr:hypothetical protein [Paroceanicella profunda]QDL92518.1 hypothetical protein FDP22_12450 [Paroceanicella profunda]